MRGQANTNGFGALYIAFSDSSPVPRIVLTWSSGQVFLLNRVVSRFAAYYFKKYGFLAPVDAPF